MSTITTPYMGLVLPVPTAELGPAWALELNNALGANALISGVDGHDHSPGKGVLITPSGISINADLPMGSNNLTSPRSIRLLNNASPITASSPDLLALYASGADLYYNDGNGNQIRITQSGNVSGSAGTITGLPSGTASAAYQSVAGTFQFLQSTSTAANIDVGSIIIRYPGSYPTPAGNYILLTAPTSLSSGYNLELPSLPVQTNVMALSATGVISSITYDAVAFAISFVGANQIASNTDNPNFGGLRARESGQNLVVSNTNATNSLAVLRGLVDASGSLVTGEGFTPNRVGTGHYTVTYGNSFNDVAAVIVSVSNQSNISIQTQTESAGGFTVFTYNSSNGALANAGWAFIAVGQRT